MSSFVSYVPKTGTNKERKIARGRRRINHYYFFIKDPEFGVGNSIRISSYAPFPVTVCFNGHNFVAQQLNKHNRLLRWQDTIDETTVSSRFVEKLGQPTVRDNGQRVSGLNMHNPRLYLALSAVLQFSHLITGFRNRELREYLQRRFGLSPDEYTAAQLRYDLLKLRAKGWIRKLNGKTIYVLTPNGIQQATAIVKLNECLDATTVTPVAETPEVRGQQTETQKCYRRVRRNVFRGHTNLSRLKNK